MKLVSGLFCEVGVAAARELSVLTVLSVFMVLTELMEGNIERSPFSRSLRRSASGPLGSPPRPGGAGGGGPCCCCCCCCEALRGEVSIPRREGEESKCGGRPLPDRPLPRPFPGFPPPSMAAPSPGGTPRPLVPTMPLSGGGTEGPEPMPVPRPPMKGGRSLLGSGCWFCLVGRYELKLLRPLNPGGGNLARDCPLALLLAWEDDEEFV